MSVLAVQVVVLRSRSTRERAGGDEGNRTSMPRGRFHIHPSRSNYRRELCECIRRLSSFADGFTHDLYRICTR